MSEKGRVIRIVDSMKCSMSGKRKFKERVVKDGESVHFFQIGLLINKK